jgi:hypothetical protein
LTKTILLSIFLIFSINGFGIGTIHGDFITCMGSGYTDSLENQILYNGRIWSNKYSGIDGYQFLFSSDFLPGSVKIDDYTFNNVSIRYDIVDDELLIQTKDGITVQLNKEMIGSFSLRFNNEILNFKNFGNDPGGTITGYWHVLYDAGLSIYVKYRKEILSTSITNGPPRFNQVNKIYIIKDDQIHRIDTRKDLLNLFGIKGEKMMIKEYIRNNHIRISRNDPGIFRRVIEYYETITK